jgi:hypothetical protein
VGGDFSAVYVRLMQGALIAQLSKDILGEAPPAAAPHGGAALPEASRAGSSDRPADLRQAEGAASARARSGEALLPQQALPVSSSPAAGTLPGRPASDVVPDQLEPAMRAAADERPATAAAADTVQRLRMTPAASLTLAGLSRPLGPSGERTEPPQTSAAAAGTADPQNMEEAGQPPLRQPPRIPGQTAAIAAAAGGQPGDAAEGGARRDDGPAPADPRRAASTGTPLPAGAAAASVASQQGQAATPASAPILPAMLAGEGAQTGPAAGTAADAAALRGLPVADPGLPQAAGAPATARAPALLSPAEAAAFLAAVTVPGAAEGIDTIRTSSIAGPPAAGSMPAASGEAFLAAIAAIGNRPDQAVSRDMLAAVILNAAMIPGWPFPRALENPAHAADARRAGAQLAAAGTEEFKLTPEEMIAYLTSIGANARLLKALQDLFARVEKKEAVKLMAWLVALTSALREIEKSVEDLLRKGTRLPEWAEDMADQIKKSLSRRHRFQI